MDSPSQTAPPGAMDAVVQSFEGAWRHMTHLMFTGPDVSVKLWARWGLVALLAAATGGGGGGSGVRQQFGRHSGSDVADFHSVSEFFQWVAPYLMLALLAVLVLVIIILVCLWLVSRFRMVLLENVVEGRPAIAGVFGQTSRAGNSYFVYQLVTTVAAMILFVGSFALIWGPLLVSLIQGQEPSVGPILGRVVGSLLLLVPLMIFFTLLDWFVYDLVLPYLYRDQSGFLPALSSAWSLTTERFGAVLVFLLARFLVGIVGGIAQFLAACLSCVVWGLPAAMIAGLVFASIKAPILLILTGPAILLLSFLVAWIVATITAPVPVFYRAWSWMFICQLDPSFLPIGAINQDPAMVSD